VGALLNVRHIFVWAAVNKSITIFNSKKPYAKVRTIADAHTHLIHNLLHVDLHVWSCSSDKTIRVWNEKGECVKVLEGHTSRVFGMAHLRHYVWSYSWDKSLMAWSSDKLEFVVEMKQAHRDAILSLVCVKSEIGDTEVWTGGEDKSIHVWTDRPLVPASSTVLRRIVVALPDGTPFQADVLASTTCKEVLNDIAAKKRNSIPEGQLQLFICFRRDAPGAMLEYEVKNKEYPLILKIDRERRHQCRSTFILKVQNERSTMKKTI